MIIVLHVSAAQGDFICDNIAVRQCARSGTTVKNNRLRLGEVAWRNIW